MLKRICASSVTRTISDATQRLMRLNWFDDALDVREVARVRVGRVLHPGAQHPLARPHEHKVAPRRHRHLSRELDRVVVEQRAALRIELVAAVLEHLLGRRLVRRPLAVKRQRRLARRHAVPDRERVGKRRRAATANATTRARRRASLRAGRSTTQCRRRWGSAQSGRSAARVLRPRARQRPRRRCSPRGSRRCSKERAHTAALNRLGSLPTALETARRRSRRSACVTAHCSNCVTPPRVVEATERAVVEAECQTDRKHQPYCRSSRW